MTTRHRVLIGALGLVAAGFASAEELTVRAQMRSPAVDAVGLVAETAPGVAINCQTNAATGCVATYAKDTAVTLTASPVTNASFIAWGDGCAEQVTAPYTGLTCTVTMSASRTVNAYFKPAAYQLGAIIYPKATTQTPVPTYGGTLAAAATVPAMACAQGVYGAGVTFLAGCNVAAPAGGSVDVVATPNAGSRVTGWVGCASVSADKLTCTVAMGGPKAVTAYFGATNMPVTAKVFGGGSVTASGADPMACTAAGGDCTSAVAPGGSITLTAVEPSGSKFVAWTGACTGTALTCDLTNVVSAQTAVATFKSTSCNSCHGVPPASHGTAATNCGACHAGFSSSTVNTAIHMNGKVDVTNPPVAPPTAGFAIEITGTEVVSGSAPKVTFRITDPANGNAPLTLNCTGTSCTGGQGVGTPSFTLSKLKADGTYESYFVRGRDGLAYTKPDGTAGAVAITNGDTSSTCTIGGADPCATQATSDTFNAARLVGNGNGSYTYTFSTAVTVADPAQLHTLAVWGTRTVSGYAHRAYDSSDFAPDATPVATREVVTDAACDACHGGLTLHGSRRGVKSCLTCHSPQTVDPESGNNVDMAAMIHKIHEGEGLANGYFIVGNSQSYFSVEHILMAPSHSGYFEGAGTYATAHDPGLARECGLCHQGAQAGNAFSRPSRRACGSCHDDVDFTQPHGGGFADPQLDDLSCATSCHTVASNQRVHSRFYEPTFNVNFLSSAVIDPPIPAGGHVFEATLQGVTGNAANLTFTVEFKLDGAAFDIKNLGATYRFGTCAFNLAGPTTDYALGAATAGQPVGGTVGSCASSGVAAAAWTGSAGVFSITPATAVTFFSGKPAGYYTASLEMMIQRVWGDATNAVRKPFSANPNFLTLYWDGASVSVVTDPATLALNARRSVVEFDKCNSCHVDLGFHSNRGRKGPDYCAMCHNPKLDNGSRARAKAADAYTTAATGSTPVYLPESVSMNVFIHRIHMGSRLPSVLGRELSGTSNTAGAVATASPWVPEPGRIVYGATRSNFTGLDTGLPAGEDSPPELADFTEFAMPNYMNRCEQCHVDVGAKQTWALPQTPGLAPVERTYRVCNPYTPVWDTEEWCNAPSGNSSGMPKTGGSVTVAVKVVTPPQKAVCTSCHDSLATDAHADLFTINPMTAGATEMCVSCHGAGQSFDSLLSHRPVP